MDDGVPLPPSATGAYKIRVKVKSLPPLASGTMTTTSDEQPRIYRCKYCPFTSHWPKDVARHEQHKHANYSSFEQDEPLDTSNGLSSLLIDEIHDFGEEIASPNDEMILIEEDNDDDDDDDAYALRFLSPY